MADDSEAERGHQIVVEGMKSIYRNIVRPIESATKFEHFHFQYGEFERLVFLNCFFVIWLVM
jgi:hypothetical protein